VLQVAWECKASAVCVLILSPFPLFAPFEQNHQCFLCTGQMGGQMMNMMQQQPGQMGGQMMNMMQQQPGQMGGLSPNGQLAAMVYSGVLHFSPLFTYIFCSGFSGKQRHGRLVAGAAAQPIVPVGLYYVF
jgi:hypothetical protein